MATLSVRFEGALTGSDLTAHIDAQADQLAALGRALDALTHGRPPGLDDLERSLGELPGPDLRIPGDLATGIAGLRSAVPTDVSGIVDGLLAEVQALQGMLEGFVTPLVDALAALEAVGQLTGIDLSCSATASAAEAGSGSSPPRRRR